MIHRQSESNLSKRMEILKANIKQVKRNVARKSTSNRPLKTRTNAFATITDKTDLYSSYDCSTERCFKINVLDDAFDCKKDNSSDFVEESLEKTTNQKLSCRSTTGVETENCKYREESEEEDEDIEGIFSISRGLVPFLGESNLSPPYLSDSADESLDTLKILNYPVNEEFPGAIYKDVPYYSNKLVSSLSPVNTDCDKSELVKCNLNAAFNNNKKEVKVIASALPDSVDTKTSEDTLDIPDKRLVGVSVREDYVICEDRPMKMTVIEAEDFDVGKFDNVTDDINFHEYDDANEESGFPKLVCAVSLGPGSELDFDDIVNQHFPQEPQNVVSKKRKQKKRKSSSNIFFGSRSKKRAKRPCKSKVTVNTYHNLQKDLQSSQDVKPVLNDITLKPESNNEQNTEKAFDSELENYKNLLHSIKQDQEISEPPDHSFNLPKESLQSNSNNSQNDTSVETNLREIKSEVYSADESEEPTETKNSLDSDSSLEKSITKEKHTDLKKKSGGSSDKKCKKEINEGVLLHVEAAKETEIMRDGKILKDKEELLKDIESKIEKNLPVEVKEFDIQQSLTEEILLEQALRLAHQRTSPRRRPLLSKSETKAILSCLANQNRYKTRKSNDKKSGNDISSSEDKSNPRLNASTDNSDSEVKNPNCSTSNERNVKASSNNKKKKGSKSRKKSNAVVGALAANENDPESEKLDMNILAKTFENVLQEFQNANISEEVYLKEGNYQPKGTNRKKKSNKKSKNKKKSVDESDKESMESDAFYESTISQDSNHDNSSAVNEECKNKRIPVIIIKNKKVTIADHKSKKGRHTNNLFSIIKTRESNDIGSSEKEIEESEGVASSPAEEALGNRATSDAPVVNNENISTHSSILDSSDIQGKSNNNSTETSNINTDCESQSSEIIRKDESSGKSVENPDELINRSEVTTTSKDNSLEAEGPKSETDPSPITTVMTSSESSAVSCERIPEKYSEDIVEVIDMEIADEDSPKKNGCHGNSSQDQINKGNTDSNECTKKIFSIPFLDSPPDESNKDSMPGSDMAEGKLSHNSIALPEAKIGFPIPTLSEVNAQYSSNIKPSFEVFSSPVKANSIYQIPTTNMDCTFNSPPPSLPGFASSPTSMASVSGIDTSSLSGFTSSVPQESIASINQGFYSSYSLAPSTSVSHFSTSSSYQPSMNSISVTTSAQLCNGPYQQNTPLPPSGVHSYPPLITSGISNNIQITPVVQSSPLIPDVSTASLHPPQINVSPVRQFSNFSYAPPLPNSNADSKLATYPYPPSSNEHPSTVLNNDVKSSPAVNEVKDHNVDLSTQSKFSPAKSELKVPEKPSTNSSAPTPEAERHKLTDIPLSIAARDPRLRNRGLRLVMDSSIISLALSVDKTENKPNAQQQSNVTNVENVQPEQDKCAEDAGKDAEVEESKNETEHNNEITKKKPKKKEIDQELLYKTPLSDLHDGPERTSYSRKLARKPGRVEVRKDPRPFQRETNGEVSVEHQNRPENRWDNTHEYSQPVGYSYYEGGLEYPPETQSPNIHLPDPNRIEDYDGRIEHYTPDIRSGYNPIWRQDEFPQETKRAREYPERRPLLETPSDYRRTNYRPRESYSEANIRPYDCSQDFRRQNSGEYRRRDPEDPDYSRWDYAHKRVAGSFPPEVPEIEKPYSFKISEEDRAHQGSWEDENEIRDLIEGPIASASRPFYRRKRFTKPWKPAHLRDDDSSSSPYSDELFERRRDSEMRHEEGFNERSWERSRNRKFDDERMNGTNRDDRRYHRFSRGERSRSPRRDYEMYEKKRARSPRRRERNRGPGRGSVSPLESPMSPEPEVVPYSAPPKYLPIPQ